METLMLAVEGKTLREAQVNITPMKQITTKGKTVAYASWFSYYAELLEENNIKRSFIT